MVPETSYSSSYLTEEPLDKSYDFISSCGQNSFHIKSVFHSWMFPFCTVFQTEMLNHAFCIFVCLQSLHSLPVLP